MSHNAEDLRNPRAGREGGGFGTQLGWCVVDQKAPGGGAVCAASQVGGVTSTAGRRAGSADGILRRAAELLARQGWCQHAYERLGGGLDLAAAVGDAAWDLGAGERELRIAESRLERQVGPLAAWNDEPGRRKADVLGVLLGSLDQQPPQRRSKVLTTIASGAHRELLRVTGPTFRYYARIHGYDADFRTTLLTPERPASWNRIPLICELLSRYEVVVWVDCDAAIVDPSEDIADHLCDRLVAMAALSTVEGAHNPNCGVMALRSSPEVQRFLESVWRCTKHLNHRWWENAAWLELLGYELEPVVRLVAPTPMYHRTAFLSSAWNHVPAELAEDGEPPRILHYPGHSQDARLRHLGAALDRMCATGLA
jgi:hypothetical protein